MKKYLLLVVVIGIGAAYVAGYWPERQRRVAAQREAQDLRVQLDESQGHVRLCRLEGQLLHTIDAVEAKNYGDAQVRAAAFFDEARREATRPHPEPAKVAIERILQMRDSVTVGLDRVDGATLETLRRALGELRSALGQPLTATPVPASPPATPPSA